MGVYTYNQSKGISEIQVAELDSGGLCAHLKAADGVKPEVLRAIIHQLTAEQYYVTPIIHNGQPALEVRGIKSEPKFIKHLEENGWLSGQSTYQKGAHKKHSIGDIIKKRTLQLSGSFFVLADIGFTTYGALEKRWEDVVGGLAYMAGSATMAKFGHGGQSNLQLRKEARKILEFAKEYDLRISPDDAIRAISESQPRSKAQRVTRLFEEYPAEIGNTITGFAGLMIALSALKSRVWKHFDPEAVGREIHENYAKENKIMRPEDKALSYQALGEKTIKKRRFAGRMDVGLGSTTLSSGLIGAWLKEKHSDPDAPKAEGLAKIMEWVQEKPLRVAGFGYMISTACHAVSTAVEYKDAKITRDKKSMRAVPFRAGFIVCTIIGEILLALSSKGHGEGVKADTSADDTIIAMSANLIHKQPKAMQEELIGRMARFLGRPDVLAIKDTEAEQKLREQVELMRKNPWALVTAEARGKQSAAPSTPCPTGTACRVKPPAAAWQAKVTAPDTNPTPPMLSG